MENIFTILESMEMCVMRVASEVEGTGGDGGLTTA